MFLDYLYNLPNATTGLDPILVQTATAVPKLYPFLLLFVWMVVMLGGTRLQRLSNGTADYPMWSVVASLSTFLVSLFLGIKSGFLRLDVFVVVVVVTIFSGVWLFLDRKQSEV